MYRLVPTYLRNNMKRGMTRLVSASPINSGPSVAAVSFVRLLFRSSAKCITLTLLNTELVNPRAPSVLSVTGRNLVCTTHTRPCRPQLPSLRRKSKLWTCTSWQPQKSNTLAVGPPFLRDWNAYLLFERRVVAALTLFTWDLSEWTLFVALI